MTRTELVNLCARIASSAQTDLSIIGAELKKLDDPKYLNSDRLAWALAHLNNSMIDYVRDLERMQKALINE